MRVKSAFYFVSRDAASTNHLASSNAEVEQSQINCVDDRWISPIVDVSDEPSKRAYFMDGTQDICYTVLHWLVDCVKGESRQTVDVMSAVFYDIPQSYHDNSAARAWSQMYVYIRFFGEWDTDRSSWTVNSSVKLLG